MNEHSHVRIESPAFASESVHLLELSGREAISQLFEFHAQVASSDPAGLDVDALIGAPAVLVFERGGAETRRMGGLIAGIRDSMHEETGKMVYDLWFAPRAFRLGLVETYEIFMDLSVPDIVKKKLERAGLLEDQDYELRLTASYPPREFVVQYQESDLAFVSRLLEHVGVCFFFEHRDGADVLVLSDANSGFGPPVDGKEVPFRSRGERQGVFTIESQTRMTPAQYVVKDYNYRTPQLALQATAPNDKGDGGFVMEYGAHFKNPDEGAVVARIRAEELAASRTILDGKSDRHGFSAGAMVLLEGHPRGDMPLLLTEVHHRAATSALGTGKESARDYENTFKAIPGKTPYRPGRITPKPRIHGVITGVIDAAAKGPYAELDADGRYRVRFLFDAGDAGDGQASRLCRMAQPHGGGGYGMHFPLRSGVEVILTFVEGDPDRPIILGVVPNPQTPSPVTGGNGTRNIIRTGGGNEINIDDTAGAERIKISSPFGRSSFQIGEKNCPEQGLVACSDESASTVTKKTINVMTPAANTIADYIKALCAEDITYYCSAAVNFLAKADAWLTVGGDALEAVKAAKDELSGYSAWALTLEAAHKELQVKLSQKKDEVRAQQDHTKEHELEAELASVDAELGTIQRTTVEAIERANTLDARKLALQEELHAERERIEAKVVEDASVQALDAKVSAAKDHQEKVEDAKAADDEADWTKKAAEDLKTYGIDPVKSLVSTFSAYGGWVAQNTATAKTVAAAGAGTSAASLGTIKSTVGPFMSPAFTGGADYSAALVAGVNAVVYGGIEASLVSICEAGVFGGSAAFLKSKVATEVYATGKTLVGAGGTITIESGASTTIASGTSTNVEAQTGLSLSAREANVVINADSENVIVNAKKKVQVTGQAEINQASPKITLKAETSELVLDDAKATAKLGRGDWWFAAHASSVVMGNGASYCLAAEGEVVLTDGTGTLSFKGGNLNVDGGTITLKGSGTAKLDGNKIFIG